MYNQNATGQMLITLDKSTQGLFLAIVMEPIGMYTSIQYYEMFVL